MIGTLWYSLNKTYIHHSNHLSPNYWIKSERSIYPVDLFFSPLSPEKKKTLTEPIFSLLGRTIGAMRYRAPHPSPFLIFSDPLSLSFPFASPSLLWVYLCPSWVFLPPLVGFSSPFVAFNQSPWWLLDGRGFLMWLGLSLWHMIWRLLPTRALPLERFRSESLLLYPPCLRLDLFKHLIVVCPYAWFAWSLLPCLYRFKQKIIRSVEDWFSVVPTCLMLIWTSLAIDALTALLVVCKSHVLGPFVCLLVVCKSFVMSLFPVVFFVVALIVYCVIMCFCSGFLPRSVVPSSIFEDLVAGRLPFLCILSLVL